MDKYHPKSLQVVRQCLHCGQEYAPYKAREQTQRYCSLPCSRAAGVAKMAKMRAAGELIVKGRSARRSGGTECPSQGDAAPPRTRDQETAAERHSTQEAQDWLEAAQRYDQMTVRIDARDARQGNGRTLILAGYGAGLRVERDALVVREGHTHHPQTPITHTLYRGMHDVERIVWLGADGALSFPALQWCTQQDIAVVLIGRDGDLISTLTPEAESDVKLRRSQYLAQGSGQDVVIARELVRRKLEGQRATIEVHLELLDRPRAVEALDMALAWFSLPEPPPWLNSLEMLRVYEGRAARAYFAAWAGLPLRWAKGEAKRIPPHWLKVRERTSPLARNGNARRAVDPLNANLNYAYGLLEGQVRQALTVQGFDLACGFLHADKLGRDSLVYDLMELFRPQVDALVLDFLAQTTFHAGDFLRLSDGLCRLHPQLARAVVGLCRVGQGQVVEGAKWLVSLVTSNHTLVPLA
jgi:CRISPR-associated protein Cas1